MASAKQTLVSLAVKQAVARASKIVSAYGKMQATVDTLMVEQYPTKRGYMAMDWDVHAAFLRALRTDDNATTRAYIYACDWLRENRGGLRNKAGNGFKDGKHGDGPIAAAVWIRTFGVKLEAAFEYVAKVPKSDIEPAMLADITEICAKMNDVYALIETYRAAEKLAAEDDANAAKIEAAQAKTAKAA